ncbi:PREDICTED: uncharacterized protein LOC109236073 [Nicotiana attenuata]|uniref:uncharacterized protein LOC109236073 n=1 Tax=Nicotiana attenuata TaxID=49451 RepID=UPI000904DCCE|nr:PREDICTED: uncharacterized protein LOC109236073 [Nicotiana attenuata]
MVFAWLSNAPSKDIVDSALHCGTARDLWRDTEERYGQSSVSRYYQIKRKNTGVSQGSSDIASYYTNLKKLWDELLVQPTLVELNHRKAYSILFHDGSQSGIKSSGSLFASESASFSVKSSPTSGQFNNTSAQFNNGHKPYPQKVNIDAKRGNLVCEHCKKHGHFVEKCYKLHGFPSDFKFIKGRKSSACTQVDLPASECQNSSENVNPL